MGPNVTGLVANSALLAFIRRFLRSKEAIEEAYRKAGEAKVERLTEVVITSGTLEGGATAGQIAGDPEEMMVACEVALQEIEAENTCGVSPSRLGGSFYNFSTRPVGS